MISSLFKLAVEATKKAPWWKIALITAGSTAVITVGSVGAQKAVDKLFREKKKSLKNKLSELKALLDNGDITEEEYQKIRQSLLDRFGREA